MRKWQIDFKFDKSTSKNLNVSYESLTKNLLEKQVNIKNENYGNKLSDIISTFLYKLILLFFHFSFYKSDFFVKFLFAIKILTTNKSDISLKK